MSDDDGFQLYFACRSSDSQEALQLVTSWDEQRIRDAVQHKGYDGWTPLHWACIWGHDKVVEMLLKHGADTKVKNDDDETPLHEACIRASVKVVEVLLKYGADTKAKNDHGQTPLHLACVFSSTTRKAIQQLLRHGADPDARDFAGARPLDLLLSKNFIKLEVVAALLGATRTPCSYKTSNTNVQGLIHAEQARRWRCAAAVLCSVGWRVDPLLFNVQDLQAFGDGLAALTFATQAAPTN